MLDVYLMSLFMWCVAVRMDSGAARSGARVARDPSACANDVDRNNILSFIIIL